ncbi:HalOD1 output domain-containing protein [Haladaptatus sp. NG-WS-4]
MTDENPSSDLERSDETPEPNHTTVDWSQATEPSIAVVDTVAADTGREPTDIPPLYNSIYPDALDALLTATRNGSVPDVRVTFTYDGMDITVTGGGTVTAREKRLRVATRGASTGQKRRPMRLTDGVVRPTVSPTTRRNFRLQSPSGRSRAV